MNLQDVILAILMLLMAILFSSVGHGGASGYLAAMAIVGTAPAIMKPTALALNILVSSIAIFKFYRVGSFSWRLFLPLAATAMPMAYVGGTLHLPAEIYKPIVGLVLIFSAWRLFHTAHQASTYTIKQPHILWLLLAGASLGFLSGLTGVGGGIFLSPLLLFFRWASVKVVSGVAAAFIFVNSASGMLGVMSTHASVHPLFPILALVVVVGAYLGAEFGSKRLGNPTIQRLLSVVLMIAGIKMLVNG